MITMVSVATLPMDRLLRWLEHQDHAQRADPQETPLVYFLLADNPDNNPVALTMEALVRNLLLGGDTLHLVCICGGARLVARSWRMHRIRGG